jgi:hypothetical protein
MGSGATNSIRAGRYVQQPTGYRAFIPAPLGAGGPVRPPHRVRQRRQDIDGHNLRGGEQPGGSLGQARRTRRDDRLRAESPLPVRSVYRALCQRSRGIGSCTSDLSNLLARTVHPRIDAQELHVDFAPDREAHRPPSSLDTRGVHSTRCGGVGLAERMSPATLERIGPLAAYLMVVEAASPPSI